jgi:hypothetical protein
MDDHWDGNKSIRLQPLTADRIRDLWSRTYNREGKPDWSHLFPYYHENIIFEDSIQRIEGINEFTAMCSRLTKRCEQLNMDILSLLMDSHAVLFDWKMTMRFKKYPSTPIYGSTKLILGDDSRILFQRDYFDLWGPILDGIPPLHGVYRKFMHRYFG